MSILSRKGTRISEYNAYPSGLPGSSFVYIPGFKRIECESCKGEGYIKPKLNQKGIGVKTNE